MAKSKKKEDINQYIYTTVVGIALLFFVIIANTQIESCLLPPTLFLLITLQLLGIGFCVFGLYKCFKCMK